MEPLRRQDPDAPRPLVIITSNVERQLPDAFLRRCVFFYIAFPKDRGALRKILVGHLGKDGGTDGEGRWPLLDAVIDVVVALREREPKKKPAIGEARSWLQALLHATDDAQRTEAQVKAFAGDLERKRRVDWRTLPALGCLLKTREDIDHVMGREPA